MSEQPRAEQPGWIEVGEQRYKAEMDAAAVHLICPDLLPEVQNRKQE